MASAAALLADAIDALPVERRAKLEGAIRHLILSVNALKAAAPIDEPSIGSVILAGQMLAADAALAARGRPAKMLEKVRDAIATEPRLAALTQAFVNAVS